MSRTLKQELRRQATTSKAGHALSGWHLLSTLSAQIYCLLVFAHLHSPTSYWQLPCQQFRALPGETQKSSTAVTREFGIYAREAGDVLLLFWRQSLGPIRAERLSKCHHQAAQPGYDSYKAAPAVSDLKFWGHTLRPS